jgi:peptidyl-tRNA hydrolase
VTSILEPLAQRYSRWLRLDPAEVLDDRDEALSDVRAMQLILRLERDPVPLWSDALVAASRAATAVCLDPRSEPGGEWHDAVRDYLRAHIRKVTRRARAGQWDAVDDLPGITVTVGTAQVRALLPGPVTDLDKRVSRLQVGGTDVPVDLAAGDPGKPVSGSLLLLVPEHLPMTAGKLMAQTGHAGMITAALLADSDLGALDRWISSGFPATIRRVAEAPWEELKSIAGGGSGWHHRVVAVRDAGFTEIDPGTITVIADAKGL